MSDVETVRTALFAWSPIDTGADEPLGALARIEADIAQLLEDNAKMLEYGEDVGWIHAGDIEKNRAELARLRVQADLKQEAVDELARLRKANENNLAGWMDDRAGMERRQLKTEAERDRLRMSLHATQRELEDSEVNRDRALVLARKEIDRLREELDRQKDGYDSLASDLQNDVRVQDLEAELARVRRAVQRKGQSLRECQDAVSKRNAELTTSREREGFLIKLANERLVRLDDLEEALGEIAILTDVNADEAPSIARKALGEKEIAGQTEMGGMNA